MVGGVPLTAGQAPPPPPWAPAAYSHLFRIVLDRTRAHHQQLRAQMAEFEDWLADVTDLVADDDLVAASSAADR